MDWALQASFHFERTGLARVLLCWEGSDLELNLAVARQGVLFCDIKCRLRRAMLDLHVPAWPKVVITINASGLTFFWQFVHFKTSRRHRSLLVSLESQCRGVLGVDVDVVSVVDGQVVLLLRYYELLLAGSRLSLRARAIICIWMVLAKAGN